MYYELFHYISIVNLLIVYLEIFCICSSVSLYLCNKLRDVAINKLTKRKVTRIYFHYKYFNNCKSILINCILRLLKEQRRQTNRSLSY